MNINLEKLNTFDRLVLMYNINMVDLAIKHKTKVFGKPPGGV